MRCPGCSTDLLHSSRFCPNCGTGLPEESEQPLAPPPNLVYLPQPQNPTELARTNVLGEPVAARYRLLTEEPPVLYRSPYRPLATALLLLVLLLIASAFGVVYAGLAAEGGMLVLIAAAVAVAALAGVDPDHASPLGRGYDSLAEWVDRRVDPLRRRADIELTLRREREVFEKMRRERARRVGELGETAYRQFRAGQLPESLRPHAERILKLEQHMLMQDDRMHRLTKKRDRGPETAE